MLAEGEARRADLAFGAAVLAGILFLAFLGPLERRLDLIHDNDFSGIWAGARAMVLGQDPYDATSWRQAAAALGTQTPDTPVYGYPPWVAVALIPLALLPLETASSIWMVAGIAGSVIGLRALLRACLPGRPVAHAAAALPLLTGQPAFHAIVLGQWSPLLLAVTCAAVILHRRGRGGLAGTAALGLIAKPQLAIGALVGFTLAARAGDAGRRMVLSGAAGTIVIVGLATLALPGWWHAWSIAVAPQRLERSASLASGLGDVLGPTGVPLAAVLVGAGAVLALRFRSGSEASLAAWLALGIAAAPYAWSYDHLLLLAPLVIAGGSVARRDVGAALRLVVAGALVLLVASPVLYGVAVLRHRESFSAAVPVAFFIAIVAACWPARHD